jgi:oligo-1,6-glucosidase
MHCFLKLLWVTLLAACAHTAPPPDPPTAAATPADTAPNHAWWKEVVVFQIYPRSFRDSDGDGIGELRGITSQLDYIKSLGVDVVWLNPIYGSPNVDNGYDISDYRAIMSEMGSMADVDAMLRGMHQRGIKLIMDLVVNHTSDEHRWFQQSRSSRDNPYRAYYRWPAEKGTQPQPASHQHSCQRRLAGGITPFIRKYSTI